MARKVRILVSFMEYTKGQEIDLETDKNGIVLDRFWRHLIKENKEPKLIEVITKAKKPEPKEKETNGNQLS